MKTEVCLLRSSSANRWVGGAISPASPASVRSVHVTAGRAESAAATAGSSARPCSFSAEMRTAAPRDVSFYRAVLDGIWERFGQERLIYGSNWPVCEQFADLATVERIAVDYFESKGAAAAAAVLAANARRVYRGVERGRE